MRHWIYIICGTLLLVGCSTPAAEIRKATLDAEYQRGVNDTKESAYKQGQIDALTGHIKYRLMEDDEHQLTWRFDGYVPTTRPSLTVRSRTASDMPYLAPMNDGHGGYIYVPMQELDKVEN